MGFWNDGVRSRSRSRSPSRHNSHSQHHTSHSNNNPYYASRPSNSRSASSFFSALGGGGGGGNANHSSSRGYGSSRARPRSGFIARIRHFLRSIYEKFKRNPVKMFFLVIMPLITSGVLVKLFASVGIRLPAGVQRMMGGAGGVAGGMGGMRQAERFYARGGARDFDGGGALPGMMGSKSEGWGDSIGTVVGIARSFM